MPEAKLTRGEWAEVRAFVEKTGDVPKASREFKVPANAIHQRSHREGWLTPKKVLEATLIEEAKKMAKAASTSKAVSVVNGAEEMTLEDAVEKMTALRKEMPVKIAEGVADKIKEGLTHLTVPKTWKEFATAVGIFANMTGMNKQAGIRINVGNGMAWGQSDKGAKPMSVVLEAEEV